MDGKRAGLALLLTLVVSCGGASPASSGGTGASAATSTGSAASTGAGTPATAQPGTNSSQPKLLELLSAAKLTQYKVTYKLSATGGGAGLAGEQSWYFKPPKARFDFATDMGGQKTTISFFSLPEGQYYCFAGGGTSQCLSIMGVGSPLDQNLAASFQESLINNPDQYGGTYTGTKTIAGLQGLCYDVKAVATVATGLSAQLLLQQGRYRAPLELQRERIVVVDGGHERLDDSARLGLHASLQASQLVRSP